MNRAIRLRSQSSGYQLCRVLPVIIHDNDCQSFGLVVRFLGSCPKRNPGEYLHCVGNHFFHFEARSQQASGKGVGILVSRGAIDDHRCGCNRFAPVIVHVVAVRNYVSVSIPARLAVCSHYRLVLYRRADWASFVLIQHEINIAGSNFGQHISILGRYNLPGFEVGGYFGAELRKIGYDKP